LPKYYTKHNYKKEIITKLKNREKENIYKNDELKRNLFNF